MDLKLLKKWINLILESDILGEPDLTNQEEREKELKDKKDKKEKEDKEKLEMSVAAGMPGVTTPLGTGPTYPAKVLKRTKKKKKTK